MHRLNSGRPQPRSEPTQLRALADEHGLDLLAHARRLMNGDVHAAQDVVQETMIRAWQHPDAFRSEQSSARGWLFTVARNVAMDHHRRRGRAPEVGDGPLATLTADDHTGPILLRHEVLAALGSLSPDHRQVVTFVYLRGYTVAETARRLRVPVGTVKSRTYHALRHLGTILERRGVDTSILAA